jgi:hypothetical protein
MAKHDYLLKNISTSDINLGDLRYKIPAGKIRDLLGKKTYLTEKQILESEKNGSISKRLGKTLIKVKSKNQLKQPKIEILDPLKINFPRRVKTSIVVDVKNISEELRDVILNEDDELLKELQMKDVDMENEGIPLFQDE